MTLAASALRQDIERAKKQIAAGEAPRNVFERVVFREARDQMKDDRK